MNAVQTPNPNALSLDAINQLLASSKTRGDYEVELRNFVNGPDVGIEVDLTSGTLAGKDPKNVATGFNNARKKMLDNGQPAVIGGAAVKVILKWVDTGQPLIDPTTNEQVKNEKGVPQNIKEGHVFLINTAKVSGMAQPTDEIEQEGDSPDESKQGVTS